jgi:hypothetical protein
MRSLLLLLASAAFLVSSARAQEAGTVLELRTDPAGATVFIDGKKLGRTPLRLVDRVDPGTHRVRISLEGYRPFERRIPVGSVVRLNLTLTPLEDEDKDAPGPIRAQRAPVAATPAAADARGNALVPAAEPPSKAGPWMLGAWAGVAADALGAAPGGTYGSLALSIEKEVFNRVSLRFAAALDFQFSLMTPPDLPAGTSSGFSGITASVAVPVRVWSGDHDRASLVPELGILRHTYGYFFAVDADTVEEIGRITATPPWFALAAEYTRAPGPDAQAGSLGAVLRAGVRHTLASGALPGATAPFAAIGLLITLE